MKLSGIITKALLLTVAFFLCGPGIAGGQTQRGGQATVAVRRGSPGQGPVRHAPPRPSHHYGGHSGYVRNHYPYYPWGIGWCGIGWPYYWGSYWGPSYYSGEFRVGGAVDLNVFPKSAQVYLNGSLLGKVGKYDGFPQYLWLPSGNHELIFYLDGYKTVRKEVEVVAGVVLRAQLNLEPGEPTPVADLSVPRKTREDERRELYERYSKDRPGQDGPGQDGPGQDGPGQDRPGQAEPGPEGTGSGSSAAMVESERSAYSANETASATLKLSVMPSDAVVYVDGRFFGTASALTARNGTLTLASGTHTLEVIRPGYANQVTTVDLKPGETLAVNIQLDAESK